MPPSRKKLRKLYKLAKKIEQEEKNDKKKRVRRDTSSDSSSSDSSNNSDSDSSNSDSSSSSSSSDNSKKQQKPSAKKRRISTQMATSAQNTPSTSRDSADLPRREMQSPSPKRPSPVRHTSERNTDDRNRPVWNRLGAPRHRRRDDRQDLRHHIHRRRESPTQHQSRNDERIHHSRRHPHQEYEFPPRDRKKIMDYLHNRYQQVLDFNEEHGHEHEDCSDNEDLDGKDRRCCTFWNKNKCSIPEEENPRTKKKKRSHSDSYHTYMHVCANCLSMLGKKDHHQAICRSCPIQSVWRKIRSSE